MKKIFLTLVAFAALAAAADVTQTIDGTWNTAMQGGDHVVPVALVLKQDGTKVTGSIMMPGNEIPLQGSFENGQLALTGRWNRRAISQEIKLTAKLLEDGTMAGEMGGGGHAMHWTAERLKAKKK